MWARSNRILVVATLSLLLQLPYLARTEPTRDPDAIAKICYNSLKSKEPFCQNGGFLIADNSTGDPASCYGCTCPSGWTGNECALCESVDVCPPLYNATTGITRQPLNCTSGSVKLSDSELVDGKRMSCTCGGIDGDESTAYLCKQQPNSNWEIFVPPETSTSEWDRGAGWLTVSERAGMPSQDYAPVCPGGNCTKERYRYAYPGVWQGTLNGCGWHVGDCVSPLQGSDCIVYTCQQANISCPPPYAQKCPGWKPWTCGNPPNETKPYWSQHCIFNSYPVPDKVVKLACKANPINGTGGNPVFQCYITQVDSAVASLGMRCKTGTCIYTNTSDSPPRPPAPPAPLPPRWRKIKHLEVITLALIGSSVLGLVCAALLLIRMDRHKSATWATTWSTLPQTNGAGTTNGSSHADSHDIQSLLPGSVLCPVVLSWDSIDYTIFKANGGRRRVLKGVYGVAGHNPMHGPFRLSMFAILGPSGAGKTTLLDILAGRRQDPGVRGDVRVNGNLVSSDVVKGISGYVLQDDVLPGTLTVWEYLMFMAALRLRPEDPETDSVNRQARVMAIITQLGLLKVAHSFIGDTYTRGISGGEKRRVSIAAELITSPGLLFLDEPTTGLDSTNAARAVEVLAAVARAGVNVVMSIHQPRPDIFRLMDRILLLSGGGQVVYSGRVACAAEHFASLGYSPSDASVNIADYILDVIIRASEDETDRLVDEFNLSRIAAEDHGWVASLAAAPDPDTIPPTKYSAAYLQQLGALSTRLLRNTYRHPFLIMANFAATLVAALGLGLIFHKTGYDTSGIQNRLGVLFFMLLYLSLMSLSSLPIWREEKLLFLRERDSGAYGTSAYFTAVVLFDLIPLRMIPPTFFALLSYWLIGLHVNCASCILWFIAILVLANVASATMCMAIGAATPSNAAANMVGSLILLCFLLFGGFLLNKDSVPLYCGWISKASFFNYAYEALAVNEFHHSPVDFVFTAPIPSKELPPLRISGDGVLKEFGFVHELFYLDLLMLMFIAGVCCFLTYSFLLASGHGIWAVLQTFLSRRVHDVVSTAAPHLLLSPQRSVTTPGLGHGGHLRINPGAAPRMRTVEAQPSPSFGAPNSYVVISEEAMENVHERDEDDDELEEEGFTEPGTPGSTRDRPSTPNTTGGQPARASGLSARVPGLAEPLLVPTAVHGAEAEGEDNKVEPLVLSWENVCCVIPLPGGKSRLVLRSVSGVAGRPPEDERPGSCLFAVLGPSGAGKTTLIDILAGRRRSLSITGDIRISGHNVSGRTRRKMSGYVLQDDVLPGTSTVMEYMMFHAKLRLPSVLTPPQLRRRVRHIIDQLGLAKVMHSYIGDAFLRGLSGGEKRRVSIASELLTRPRLLFMDEPTTGLDSTNAARVVDILAQLADSGVTVIMSIHQPRPDIFRLLDRVLILSGDGQVVYTGPQDRAAAHFATLGHSLTDSTVNIADYMLDVVIKSPPPVVAALVAGFEHSEVAQQDEAWLADMQMGDAFHSLTRSEVFSGVKKYEASYWRQLRVLSERLLKHSMRHPLLILLNFVATAIMALGIGLVYWKTGKDTGGIQDRFGALFFMCLYLSLMSLSSLPVWRDDRLIFVRERAAGAYGTAAYFTAVVLFDLLPMRLLPPAYFTAFSYWMIGLREGGRAAVANLVVLVLTNTTAASLSMAIGAAAPSVSMANMVGSLAVLTTTLFSGFLLSRNKMPPFLAWISNITYMRYAFEALVTTEFEGATGFRFSAYHQPGVPHTPSIPVSGDTILRTFGFHPGSYLPDVSILLLFMGAYLAITFFLLKYQQRP